ncbi:MAG TPA: methionine--tRNA ligase [Thermoanaerobaculales bacterium]|nr:methionine--tRNA ligase [Thermoanaerobaculales bacterium]
MPQTYYITTPIYYVNDMPHIGHIYTTVMADVLARYRRMTGSRVHFLTGTDEHGQKIARAARDQGIEPIQLADRVVERYNHLWSVLEISNDDFIRTTEARHKRAVTEIIRRITAAGDIYKGSYEGWYSPGEEAFVPDSQVADGRDTATGYAVERLAEPSYFFRLSAWQDRLLAWYRDNPDCIRPQSRYNEVVSFVSSGLKDLSISRASLRWGVPYPGDDEHVVYVWLDALTNYISALGFGGDDRRLFDELWPDTLHLVGKDILRFHCVYWPAFLMSAGLPPPRQVFGHGWWLRDEAKMSKSIGNVVRPDHIIERFGPDPLRYFLARDMAFGQDSSFSDEAFVERFNADLANALGNTALRTATMVGRAFAGRVPAPSSDGPVPAAAAAAVDEYHRRMDALEPHRALEAVSQLLATINGFLQERQPWALAKKGEAARGELEATLYAALEGLRITSLLIEPVMPAIAPRLRALLGARGLPVDLGGATGWGLLPAGAQLGPSEPLFPRVDAGAYLKEITMTETTPTAPPEESLLTIDQFAAVKLVVGIVREAERVPNSKKLVRMMVDLGEPQLRQLVAGIAERYQPEALLGRRIVVVANLKPAKLMGVESRGMLLAASVAGDPFLLSVDGEVPPGTGVR